MIYTLIVTTNHLTNGRNALKIAEELLSTDNKINCIYFLFDGTYVANKFIDMPTDEFDLTRAWSDFAAKNAIQLSVCSASGLRRGIADGSIANQFKFGSIGELLSNCNVADKVLAL